MNERIEELARDCWSTSEYDTSIDPRFNHRKFAELIVRECAGIYSKIDNGNLHMGTDDYLEALHKTFFGVEQ